MTDNRDHGDECPCDVHGAEFAPCPTCHQYSHSIGNDALTAAFNHFQSMYAHPVRGHPMGHNFDETTRDAAQLLIGCLDQAEAQLAEVTKERDEARAMLQPHGPGGIDARLRAAESRLSDAVKALEPLTWDDDFSAERDPRAIALQALTTLSQPKGGEEGRARAEESARS